MKPLSGDVLLLAGLGLSAIWLGQPVDQEDPAERRAARQQQQAEQYEIKRARRDAFASFSDDICEAIAAGDLCLAVASQRILTYAESFYPGYLQHLELAEDGDSAQEKIGRNLVRYFTNLANTRLDRADPVLIARLEGELISFVKPKS